MFIRRIIILACCCSVFVKIDLAINTGVTLSFERGIIKMVLLFIR